MKLVFCNLVNVSYARMMFFYLILEYPHFRGFFKITLSGFDDCVFVIDSKNPSSLKGGIQMTQSVEIALLAIWRVD